MGRLTRRTMLRGTSVTGMAAIAGSVLAACGATPEAAPAATQPATAAAEAAATSALVATQPATAAAEATATSVPAAAAQEKVTIEFWYGWTPDMIVSTLDGIAAKFTESNPTIEVVTAQHEWGEKLLTAYAAGTPPDVHEHWLPMQFAARDLLLPVDDLVNSSKVVSVDLMPEVAWGVAAWKGEHYSVPSLAFFAETALVANPVLYEKVGLKSPDDLPKTWDDAYAQAEKYTVFDGAGNLETVWVTPDKSLRYNKCQFGVNDYDAENRRWLLDDPAWEEVVESTARFYTLAGPDKIDAFGKTFPGWIAVPGSAFAADHLALVTSGYWIPGELDKNAPGKKFDYTWVPTGGAAKGKKVTHWGAHSLMIPKKGKHPQEAWLLVEHYDTVDSAQAIFEGCGWIGPEKTFWDVMDVDRYQGLDFFVNHAAVEAEIQTVNSPSPAIAFAMDGFTQQVVDPVIYGEKTAKEALADFQIAVQEAEDKFV